MITKRDNTMTRETYEEICKQLEEGIFNAQDWSGGDFDDAFDIGREFGAFEAQEQTFGF